MRDFEVILEPEDAGGNHANCPVLKSCHSDGSTKEEALKNIKEAVGLWLESVRELGVRIPCLPYSHC